MERLTPASSQISLIVMNSKGFLSSKARSALSNRTAVLKYLLWDLFIAAPSFCQLLFGNLAGKLNDFITILLLALIENLLVDGVVYDATRHS